MKTFKKTHKNLTINYLRLFHLKFPVCFFSKTEEDWQFCDIGKALQ